MPAQETLEGPSRFPYSAGDVIAGKYELDEVLGEGGMGAVFRARNTSIDMPVAIKLIRGDLKREVFSERLLQEARAAAKLAHPAIVRVFDVGQTAQGDPFIVMELLQGEGLSAVIEREGRLTAVRAVQLLLPIADGLAAAHAKGIVHRDVKPDNVFIVVDGDQLQPKLVDFGIVKLEHRDKSSQLTQVGTVLGSPDYMSPEQARGLDKIDLRSDVWSFSVMLYEAISGQTPFSSQNYNALLRMIVEDEPVSLHALRAADAELSAIVSQGMEKGPERRFQSTVQMGKALAEWLLAQGITEDVCGVSLEAKWLSRTTDPQGRPGRASLISLSDSWPDAPSGVRTVRGDFVNAATLHVGSEPPAPSSLSAVTSSAPRDTKKLYLGAAAGAVAAGVLAAWALGLGEEPSTPVGAGSSATPAHLPAMPENEPAPQAAKAPIATSSPQPEAEPSAIPIESLPQVPAPKAAPRAAHPTAATPPAPQSEAPAAQAPQSPVKKEPTDLLSPY